MKNEFCRARVPQPAEPGTALISCDLRTMRFRLQGWMLALLTSTISTSACTVFELYSSGLASSLWHMIPAVALFADNGTFYVSSSLQCALLPALSYNPRELKGNSLCERVLAGGQEGLPMCALACPFLADLLLALLQHLVTKAFNVQTVAPRMEACMTGLTAT